jgi:alpha-1,3-glucosyltransferase
MKSLVDINWKSIFDFWGVFTALKIFIFLGYHSSDFEVHRNWMAITYEAPISEWYFEKTSKSTLDYPPFFAFFEWLLAKPAAFFDREMVRI